MMKKLTLLLFLLSLNSFCQTPNWIWGKSIDNVLAFQYPYSATDSAGNTYVAGTFMKPSIILANFTVTSHGAGDIFILKYDSNGNLLWAKALGSTDGDEIRSLCVDQSGNLIVTGSVGPSQVFWNSQLLAGYSSNVDAFIMKVDPLGNSIWFQRIPGVNVEFIFASCADKHGNIIVFGQYFNHPNKYVVGPDTLFATGMYNSKTYLAKFSPSGTILWARNARAYDPHYVRTAFLTTDNNNNIYATGILFKNYPDSTFSFGSTTYTVEGLQDTYLGQYDSLGNEHWSHHFHGVDYQIPTGLVTDKTNAVFIAVRFESPVLKIDTFSFFNAGKEDFLIAKFDLTGNLTGVNNYGNSSDDVAHSLAIDPAGDVYCAGGFCGDSLQAGPFTIYKINTIDSLKLACRTFLIKQSTSGNVQWVKSFESNYGGIFPVVTTDNLKNIYLSGSSTPVNDAIYIFGSDTLHPQGTYWSAPLYLAKLYDSSIYLNPIGVLEHPIENIFFGPNPANDKVQLNFISAKRRQIKVISELGQTVLEIQTENQHININLFGVLPGIYFLEVIDSESKVNKKLVVAR